MIVKTNAPRGSMLRRIFARRAHMPEIEQLPSGALTLLTPREAMEIAATSAAVIVDVRTAKEYAAAHVAGSLWSPLQEFDADAVMAASGGRRVILICAVGARSRHAAELLLEAGLRDVAHVEGGLGAWLEDGLPATQGWPRPAEG
jgi:rhodanese-related sulfurtransferase